LRFFPELTGAFFVAGFVAALLCPLLTEKFQKFLIFLLFFKIFPVLFKQIFVFRSVIRVRRLTAYGYKTHTITQGEYSPDL
jgi:hypothetical protein